MSRAIVPGNRASSSNSFSETRRYKKSRGLGPSLEIKRAPFSYPRRLHTKTRGPDVPILRGGISLFARLFLDLSPLLPPNPLRDRSSTALGWRGIRGRPRHLIR